MHSKAANLIISHSSSLITTAIISNNSNTSSIRRSSSTTISNSTTSRISNITNRVTDSTPTNSNSTITQILVIDKTHHNRNNIISTTSHNKISISSILIIKVNIITNSSNKDHSSRNSNTRTAVHTVLLGIKVANLKIRDTHPRSITRNNSLTKEVLKATLVNLRTMRVRINSNMEHLSITHSSR